MVGGVLGEIVGEGDVLVEMGKTMGTLRGREKRAHN